MVKESLRKRLEEIKLQIVLALALNDSAASKLEALYREKESEYRHVFEREREAHQTAYIAVFSVKYTKRLNQAHAIVTHMLEEGNFKVVLPVMKAGYNRVYRFAEHTNPLTTKKMFDFINAQAQPTVEKTDIEKVMDFVVAFYVSYVNELNNIDEYEPYTILHIIKTVEESIDINTKTPSLQVDKNNLRDLDASPQVHETYQYLMENYAKKGILDLRNFSENYLSDAWQKHPDVQAYLKGNQNKLEQEFKELVTRVRLKLIEQGKEEGLITLLDKLFAMFGFSTEKAVHALTEEETTKLLFMISHMANTYNLTKGYSIESILIATVKAMQILKEYEAANALYRDSLTQDIETQLEKRFKLQIDEVSAKAEKYEQQVQALKKKLADKTEQQKETAKLAKNLEQEVKRSRKMEESFKRMQQEVVALREYSYNTGMQLLESAPVAKEVELSDMIEYLNKLDMVIVGGNANWQTKIKEFLPHVNLISIDKAGSFKMLEKKGVTVVINTLANSHKNYHLMLKHMHPNNELHYFNEHVNIELSIRSLYDRIHK